jgi:uncharacterized membrane protein
MNRLKHLGIILALSVSFFLIFSQTVYASVDAGTFSQSAHSYYIGPGTVYIVMQVVIGLLIGGAAMMGIYRTRVKTFFSNLFNGRRRDRGSKESE